MTADPLPLPNNVVRWGAKQLMDFEPGRPEPTRDDLINFLVGRVAVAFIRATETNFQGPVKVVHYRIKKCPICKGSAWHQRLMCICSRMVIEPDYTKRGKV